MEAPLSSLYQPLDSPQQEIRVLWLLPPTNKEDDLTSEPQIQAFLTTVSLSQKPAYNALSYTWGPPDDTVHLIRLNGRSFEVRSNLHDCLVHLRRRGIGFEESGVSLWIDAICINQDDVAERNSQLPLMGDIYRNATSVISWLGSDERLVKAMGAITEIGQRWARLMEELRDAAPDEFELVVDGKQPVPHDRLLPWLRETEHIWQEGDTRLSGMVKFFQSNYWRRVWIIQELLLADPETHVYICGTASVTEADLDRLGDCVLTVFGGDKIESVSTGVWTDITLGIRGELNMRVQLSAVQLGLVSPSLMFVLFISSTREATDPRDVVYGLLHLIPDHGIIPDYRKAVWEVYTDWAVKTMLECGNVELLSYVTTKEDRRTNIELDLPSWVPDICNYKAYRDFDWLKRGEQDTSEGGHGGGFSVELCNNGRVLKVEGCRRDTVKKVTKLPKFAESKLQWRWNMVRFCIDYVAAQWESGTSHPTGIPPLQALVRLVMRRRIAALSPDEHPKRVHEVACAFIAWLIFEISHMFSSERPPEESLKTAASFLGLSWGEDFPETYEQVVFPGVDVRELMGWNRLDDALPPDPAAIMDYMINWCDGPTVIETEKGHVGLGPTNAEPGDRIVAVRHCKSPLVFRGPDPESGFVTLLGSGDILELGNGEVTRDGEYEQLWIA